ncbi:hypothetical protein LCGC14_0593570 [marine sediment metagenome]|uniref:Ribbon-helix-helix protein CopG domain-containing protein n=1 Tax=marine sediment metagenome TaxID=412755 RepID=A0A0F9RWH5_9ZZZZ
MYYLCEMSDITFIKVTGIPRKLKNQLKTIAKNKGRTLSALVKGALRKFYESQPENLKIERDLL